MKARTEFHPDRGYIVTLFEGSVTLADMSALVQSVWADPRWMPDYNGILDFSAAKLDLTEREIADLTTAMRTDPRCSLGRWALVVSTASDFAKARKADHPDDVKTTIRIFFDRRAAEDWLLPR